MRSLQRIPKAQLAGALAAILIVSLLFGYIYSNVGSRSELDPAIRQALNAAGSASTYRAVVETQAELSGRLIRIVGTYTTDRNAHKYETVSTTTLTLLDIPSSHFFTLENRAIGSEIYTKLETKSPLLLQSMPQTNGWKHFTSETIPSDFESIAVAGPVSDNLLLLSENGKYISFVRKEIISTSSVSISKYIFKLSSATPQPSGIVDSLFKHIGRMGTIEISVNDASKEIQSIYLSGDHYQSTTTIFNLNMPVQISAPSQSN